MHGYVWTFVNAHVTVFSPGEEGLYYNVLLLIPGEERVESSSPSS